MDTTGGILFEALVRAAPFLRFLDGNTRVQDDANSIITDKRRYNILLAVKTIVAVHNDDAIVGIAGSADNPVQHFLEKVW